MTEDERPGDGVTEDERAAGGAPRDDTRSGDPAEEPGLEERLRRLEEIVASLEADEVDLDRALGLFEEGVRHVRAAERILSETELRVEELLESDGGVRTRTFGAEAGDGEE